MSISRKSQSEFLQELRRCQNIHLQDYQKQYLTACDQVLFYQDLLKFESYPLTSKGLENFHVAVSERQVLAEEFLNAAHLELLNKHSAYNSHDLEALSDELCKCIEGDNALLRVLNESNDGPAERPSPRY